MCHCHQHKLMPIFNFLIAVFGKTEDCCIFSRPGFFLFKLKVISVLQLVENCQVSWIPRRLFWTKFMFYSLFQHFLKNSWNLEQKSTEWFQQYMILRSSSPMLSIFVQRCLSHSLSIHSHSHLHSSSTPFTTSHLYIITAWLCCRWILVLKKG